MRHGSYLGGGLHSLSAFLVYVVISTALERIIAYLQLSILNLDGSYFRMSVVLVRKPFEVYMSSLLNTKPKYNITNKLPNI